MITALEALKRCQSKGWHFSITDDEGYIYFISEIPVRVWEEVKAQEAATVTVWNKDKNIGSMYLIAPPAVGDDESLADYVANDELRELLDALIQEVI